MHTRWTLILTAAAVVGLVSCKEEAKPKPMPGIVRFSVDRTEITRGDAVTLSFEAANADKATITDDSGQVLAVDGDANHGTVRVTPARTTFYVLNVRSEGGSASDFVQVAVEEPIRDLFLVAVPSEVNPGQPVQLLYSATHAKKLSLKDSKGQALPVPDSAISGAVTVQPEASETFTLEATSDTQTQQISSRVLVRAVIDDFSIQPQFASPGDKVTLRWTTRFATSVTVGEETLGEVTQAAPGEVAQGSFVFEVPSNLPDGRPVIPGSRMAFTLTAQGRDPDVTRARTLPLFLGDGPAIESFQVPTHVSAGRPVTVSWSTQSAERIELWQDGRQVYVSPATEPTAAARGSISLSPITGNGVVSNLELRAFDARGAQSVLSARTTTVALPAITRFELPGSATFGVPVVLNWETHDAVNVRLRIKNGPVVMSSKQAQGSESVILNGSATYVLEAENLAGSIDSRSKDVAATGSSAVTLVPESTWSNEPVGLEHDLSSATTPTRFGWPSTQPQLIGTAFEDLDADPVAQVLPFIETDDAVSAIPELRGFSFPMAGELHDRFFVSTNGFVAFGPSRSSPVNDDPTDPFSVAPAFAAPLWMNLDLGDGRVLWKVEDVSFPRRLIVQWDHVRLAQDSSTDLTFQVQLSESGAARFAYKSLSGALSTATVGFHQDGRSPFAAKVNVPAAGETLEWFVDADPVATAWLVPATPTPFAFFQHSAANGKLELVQARLNVVSSDSVVINEVMASPSSPQGQWVELYNPTDEGVDLSGFFLTDSRNDYELPPQSYVPAHGFLMLGQSADRILNGDVGIDLEYGNALELRPGDRLALYPNGHELTHFTLPTTTTTDVSVQRENELIDVTGIPAACVHPVTSTPGASNHQCEQDYKLERIAPDFEDISTSGDPQLQLGWRQNDTGPVVDLVGAPFPFFGTAKTRMRVGAAGYLTFAVDAVYVGAPYTNFSLNDGRPVVPVNDGSIRPSPSQPNDSIAVCTLGHMDSALRRNSNVYVKRVAPYERPSSPSGYWIVQWHRMQLQDAPADKDTNQNCEAKLFDDGTLELHYGAMESKTAWIADGSHSTAWLENPTGTFAFGVSVQRNEPGLRSHTAWRLTPTH